MCSTSQLHQRLVQSNPQYRDTFSALSAGADAVRQDGEDNGFEVYTLPVVVHVIHRGSPIGTLENISDAQINSGINALNQDFRKELGTNGDGDGVDTFIQFELAKRNPEGEPTSGILRVDGRVLPNLRKMALPIRVSVSAHQMRTSNRSLLGLAMIISIFLSCLRSTVTMV